MVPAQSSRNLEWFAVQLGTAVLIAGRRVFHPGVRTAEVHVIFRLTLRDRLSAIHAEHQHNNAPCKQGTRHVAAANKEHIVTYSATTHPMRAVDWRQNTVTSANKLFSSARLLAGLLLIERTASEANSMQGTGSQCSVGNSRSSP